MKWKSNTVGFLLLLIVILFSPLAISAKSSINDSILAVLDTELDKSQIYYQEKEKKIENLYSQLSTQSDKEIQLEITNKLFDEYFSWQYDSAFVYAHRAEQLSKELANETLEVKAKLNLLRCFISSGYYKEGFELIESLDREDIPPSMKGEFYKLAMEYYDALMIYYDRNYYTKIYTRKAIEYYRKAQTYFKEGTQQYAELDAYAFRFSDADPKEKAEKYLDLLSKRIKVFGWRSSQS